MSNKENKKIKSFNIRLTALVLTVFYYIGIRSQKVLLSVLKAVIKSLLFVGKCVNTVVMGIFNKVFVTLYKGFKCYFGSFVCNKRFSLSNHYKVLKRTHDANIVKFHSFVRVLCCTVILVAVLATYGMWSQLTPCYKVVYNGATIGFIENESVYEDAVDCIGDYVGSSDAKSLVNKPEISFTLSNKSNLIEKNSLAVGMIKKTSGFSYAYGLFIDGNRELVCENYNSIDYNLGLLLNKYEYKGDNLTLEFSEDVQIIPSYYSNNIIMTANETYDYFENNKLPLNVTATVERTSKQALDYETVKIENDKKIAGYTLVVNQGKKGVEKVTKRYTYVNGKVTETKEVSREIVKSPVNKRVIYGTASFEAGSVAQKLSGGIRYIWPLNSARGSHISAYYGDGRNHKGIDIAAPAGTNIYSVSDGVVVKAGRAVGSESSYGNYVVIKHSDGKITTAYAHASKVYVSVGDVVKKGQVVAAVGSTGNSTGNHLHFEVRINGVRTNPASYLGLN